MEFQVKLLRVLETKLIRRVGGEDPIPLDVRLIAATNQDPEQAVSQGKLRSDLFFRLNVFPIHLPPLRERDDDVILLAEHFLAELNKAESTRKRFMVAALERLRAHSWPGNVRELKNVVHRAFIVADTDIDARCLPPGIGTREAQPSEELEIGLSIEEARRRLILSTLERCGGNKRKAAELLGISLKTLYNRLGAYRSEAAESAAGVRRPARRASAGGLDNGGDESDGGDGLEKASVEPRRDRPLPKVPVRERRHGNRR
jgi:two-component system, NtrC family, response regulator AtoC